MVPQMMPQMVPQAMPQMLPQMVPQMVPAGQGWYQTGNACVQQLAMQSSPATEQDAVSAFSQQIGIRPSEAHFVWIAELGLQSPLPPGWSCGRDAGTGCTYYVDEDKQISTWENPLLPYLQRVVDIGRQYLESPIDNFFDEMARALWDETKRKLEDWHGPYNDFAGRPYYVNSMDGVTSCSDPREGAQYLFDLQNSFLNNLKEILPRPAPVVPETPGSHWGSPQQHKSPGLGDGSPEKQRPNSARRFASPVVDHRSALERMRGAAIRWRDLCKDDEEVQRIGLSRKVKAREQAKEAWQRQQAQAAQAQRRPIPRPLDFGEEPSREQARPRMPPDGPPSPANQVAPPPLLRTSLAPPGEPPPALPPLPASPSSPSLQRLGPGREWAAEAFLAEACAAPFAPPRQRMFGAFADQELLS